MAKIMVHLMNWHGIFSHIDIMLENRSVSPSTYYYINQWARPALRFEHQLKVIAASEIIDADASEIINASSATYPFEIEADPEQVVMAWVEYYHNMALKEIENNCTIAAQWFLGKFANIPAPNLISAPINLNQLTLALFIPKFNPIVGITRPAHIMNNAKFYMEARKTPDLTKQYSILFLQVCAAIGWLALASSLEEINAASRCLSNPADLVASAHCADASHRFGLFKAQNTLAAREHLAAQKEHFILNPA